MIQEYKTQQQERASQKLPPLPLSVEQTEAILEMLEAGHPEFNMLRNLICQRVTPGVSEAAKVKAAWLTEVAMGTKKVSGFTPAQSVELLSMMGGGYNVEGLILLLEHPLIAAEAANCLKKLFLVYDGFETVTQMAGQNPFAFEVVQGWASAEWYTNQPEVPDSLELTVYKVEGEINTDDFSPGNQAQSRADIPLHATFFGVHRFSDGINTISEMRQAGKRVAFVGDVVGTGSSRKSAINSLAYHIGDDILGTPNKRKGGVVIGGTIAPIFYATARDAGVLPIVSDVSRMNSGDRIHLDLKSWTLADSEGRAIELEPAPSTLLEEYRVGGRLNLIIGKELTRKACNFLGCKVPEFCNQVKSEHKKPAFYTLAQKMIGKACGMVGVHPGEVCEPKVTTVGSQDTTGPMTMQELDELACRKFTTEFFLQSFCHTAAYPQVSDHVRWEQLKEGTQNRGGVTLKPGDGVIHSWLNRTLLPDSVGTGGDSHTRFPLGISFPAGSGLVAFGAALGFIPLEMPQSVLVRFSGQRGKGITVRDMVNSIPYFAMQQGLLSIDPENKRNIFAGKIIEIEGIDDLTLDEAYELSDSTAERSASACTLDLPLGTVYSAVEDNIEVLKDMVLQGYGTREALETRINTLQRWLDSPELLRRDPRAKFEAVLEIDLAKITEPILACPNNPDDVKPLSELDSVAVDEVFVGSCMTHASHYSKAISLLDGRGYAKSRFWMAPATRMDLETIKQEGGMSSLSKAGCRVELPGCSLCMGNQARVTPGATVVSTSTRNFDNRLGDGSQVYLASTELTTICGLLGRLPSVSEYFTMLKI